jgi:cystathionine gamma-synthase
MTERLDPATIAVRAGLESDPATGAVVPPIHLTSNFAFQAFGEKGKYDYTRSGNPTRDLLAGALTALEQGSGAVITSAGMSAIALVGHLFPVGSLIVAPHDCYGGTFRLFTAWHKRGELRVQFVNFDDDRALSAALAARPSLLWIETPSNPLLRITDIAGLAARGRAVGAMVAVDNTFLSPAWQLPLTLGADLVVHSTTKYLNGHSDVVGGAVVAANKETAEQLEWWANCLGVSGAPFDSFLTLRGMRTLQARLDVHGRNAEAVAGFLHGHPKVSKVFFPGLPSHPGHALARRQQKSFGAIVSVELKGGHQAVAQFVNGLELFSLAESLGGVESLVAHPATMTHAAMAPSDRAAAGLSDGLLRLSIGIENGGDLIADLSAGLDRIS